MRARKSCPPGSKEAATKSRFLSMGLPRSMPKSLIPRWVRGGRKKSEAAIDSANYDVESGWKSPYERKYTLQAPSLSDEACDRRTYFTHTGAQGTGNSLLEETSVADFLRALTTVHTHLGAVPPEFAYKMDKFRRNPEPSSPKLPSLLTLFTPPNGMSNQSQSHQNTIIGQQTQQNRRFSLRPVENTGATSPIDKRRLTTLTQPSRFRRRFSLRPVLTPIGDSPQYNTVENSLNFKLINKS